MKERIAELLAAAAAGLEGLGGRLPDGLQVSVTPARDVRHGDFASSLALQLAGPLGRPARQVADELVERLARIAGPWESVAVAGPGFLNFRVGDQPWRELLRRVLAERERFGQAPPASRERVQIEFVSANPTGPMNVVSARAGAFGDSLARIMRAAGHRVETEFYVNDAGNQARLYGLSVKHHLAELAGRSFPLPEEGYRGAYVRAIAESLRQAGAAELLEGDPAAAEPALARAAIDATVAWQERDLARFRVNFDRWFRESELHCGGDVGGALEELKRAGWTYESDGAVWLRTSAFGDSEDRVLVKSDGLTTYFLADIAYHRNKFARGFDRVIDIWGPDHHGHVVRMKAAMQALGIDPARLEILIVQQVNLLAGGEKVKMSKRAGEFVTLGELMDEVGVDPGRFFFVMRKSDSHLDFDLDLARRQSSENPIYYVQYVHARVHSLAREAARAGLEVPPGPQGPLQRLTLEEEIEILKILGEFPDTIRSAADAREVNRLPVYLQRLASRFHNYYFRHRFIGDDPELSLARLKLAEGVGLVVAASLGLLGNEAPESM